MKGWDYVGNQKELCRVALGNSSSNTLSDTVCEFIFGFILFSLSLFNLIL